MHTDVEQLGDLLVQARGACVAFTGAGMSAESGIPTFRGTGGLWEKYPPSIFGTPAGLAGAFFLRFGQFRRFLVDAAHAFLDAGPNPGHDTLAALERRGLLQGIVTQNVDNLHQQAGNTNVIDIHGNIFTGRCRRCRTTRQVERELVVELVSRLETEATSRRALLGTLKRYAARCSQCDRVVRPNVVLFGESLNAGDYERSVALAEKCRVMLVIGTSVLVRPASDIPFVAKHAGAHIVEINTEPSDLTPLADLFVNGPSGEVLPTVLEYLDE